MEVLLFVPDMIILTVFFLRTHFNIFLLGLVS